MGLGFRVQGSGFRVSDFGFRVSSFGFPVSSFGFRVEGVRKIAPLGSGRRGGEGVERRGPSEPLLPWSPPAGCAVSSPRDSPTQPEATLAWTRAVTA